MTVDSVDARLLPRQRLLSPLRVAVLVGVVVIALLPLVVGRNPFIMNILILAAIFGIVGLAVDLCLGHAGIVHLGIAASFGLGGYATGILTVRYGWEPAAAMLVALVFNLAVAYVVGRAVLRLREYFFAIATLGLNYVAINLILSADRLSGGYSGLPGVPPFSVLGLRIAGDIPYYYLTWGLAGVSLLLAWNLIHSRPGRAIRALRDADQAAQALGIDVAGYRLNVFLVSTALASIAGGLYAHYLNYVGPNSLEILTAFEFVIICVLGGTGTLIGPFVGAIIMKLLPAMIVGFESIQVLINGAILAALVLFMPHGLVGSLQRRLRHLGRRDVYGVEEAHA